jgi:hypothetical protein
MYLDGANGHRPCEDYYHLLNEFEAAEDPEALEPTQRAEIEEDLQRALTRMEAAWHQFEVELLPG